MSDRDEWYALTRFTPARLALGRSGNGIPTRRLLEFELAHAKARDAVSRPFKPEAIAASLGRPDTFLLTTHAHDRHTYLMNPDAGRVLSDASRAQLKHGNYDAALIVADGLSSTAIAAHGVPLSNAVARSLPDLKWAPVAIVSNGRVAVGDDIAATIGAELAVVLIGERPGLSAADSIGIYLTYRPTPGTTKDADRNCISNVRPDGLPIDAAVIRLAWLIRQARRLRLSGVALKEDADDLTAIGP